MVSEDTCHSETIVIYPVFSLGRFFYYFIFYFLFFTKVVVIKVAL